MSFHVGEVQIVWLKPLENYDYLREGVIHCHFRARFSFNPAKRTDGGLLSHLVGYAVLGPDVRSDRCRMFYRRYWWVKSHDRFVGHGVHSSGWYDKGSPCEAVEIASIHAGIPSIAFSEKEKIFAQ